MENEAPTTDKQTAARPYLMDAKTVAYLLAPCICFIWVACMAVIDGTDYAAMPKDKVIVERHRKYDEAKKIIAANIAVGDPIPNRQTMLDQMDTFDKRARAWEDVLTDSGQGMRNFGFYMLFGIAVQFYVVFKLRAHIKKLAVAAAPDGSMGSSPVKPNKFPIFFVMFSTAGAVALWLLFRDIPAENAPGPVTQTSSTNMDAHADLRAKYFALTRNDAMPKPATPDEPWGVMMEIGYPKKMVLTTVVFSDGTVSVLRNSGGGFFGGGAIGAVKTAAEDFLKEARKPHPELKPTHEFPQPGLGYVTFYLFTDNGILTWSGDELDLEGPMTSLSRLRLTGERILCEYIQLEKQKPKESPNKPGA
jgi:hypothetical protein